MTIKTFSLKFYYQNHKATSREDQAFNAFKEAIGKDEKLTSIVNSIKHHCKPLDDLTQSIKNIFEPLVRSVADKNDYLNVAKITRQTLHFRFGQFKNDPETIAYLTKEDVRYIITVYAENFLIQAKSIWNENKSMREIFKFDHLFE